MINGLLRAHGKQSIEEHNEMLDGLAAGGTQHRGNPGDPGSNASAQGKPSAPRSAVSVREELDAGGRGPGRVRWH